jgi:hypothetical protein
LKCQIGVVIEQSGLTDDIIWDIWELWEGICELCGFAIFILLLPLEIWGYNPITIPIVISCICILAVIPAILVGIIFGLLLAPFAALEVIFELFADVDWEELEKRIGIGGIFVLVFVIIPILWICLSLLIGVSAIVEGVLFSYLLICFYAITFWVREYEV